MTEVQIILYVAIAVLVSLLLQEHGKKELALDVGAAAFLYMEKVLGHTVSIRKVMLWYEEFTEEEENGNKA